MVAEMPAEERKTRWWEFALVAFVAGVPSLLVDRTTSYLFQYTVFEGQGMGVAGTLSQAALLVASLLTVLYILRCQGRTLSDIGLHKEDWRIGLGMFFIASIMISSAAELWVLPGKPTETLWFTFPDQVATKTGFQTSYLQNSWNAWLFLIFTIFNTAFSGLAYAYISSELNDLLGHEYAVVIGAICIAVYGRGPTGHICLALLALAALWWGLQRGRLLPVAILPLAHFVYIAYLNIPQIIEAQKWLK